jgi:hypothetical protein
LRTAAYSWQKQAEGWHGEWIVLDTVKAKVQQVHDDLLEGVLEGKQK